jgi:hypothetical protein
VEDNGYIEDIIFHLDKFANIRVVHKSGATTNLILKRNPVNNDFICIDQKFQNVTSTELVTGDDPAANEYLEL